MEAPSFRHNGTNIPVKINYGKASFVFPDMGLDLLEIFERPDEIIMTIMANDRVMLDIWYHYVAHLSPEKTSAIEELEAQEMHQFKEVFWQAILNFTASTMRPTLEAFRMEMVKRLKHPEELLKSMSSNSSQEQESTPSTTPSIN